jgi:uncharacterized protein YkwD
MNIIDLLICVIILVCAWGGYRRGFVFAMLTIGAWIGMLVLTFLLYRTVGALILKLIPKIGYWSNALAFIVLFIILQICFDRLTFWVLTRLPRSIITSRLNQLLGILPGLLNGYLWATLLCVLLLIYPLDGLFTREARKSRLTRQLTDETGWLNKRLSPAINEALVALQRREEPTVTHERTVQLPYNIRNARPRPDLEKRMLELVNSERIKRGLAPLQSDPELTIVARLHSADMLERGYFSHYTPEGLNPLDRMKQAGVHFVTGGENIAITQTLIMAHTGLMHSTDHRANILNPAFGRLGIGILDAVGHGLMITQAFRN